MRRRIWLLAGIFGCAPGGRTELPLEVGPDLVTQTTFNEVSGCPTPRWVPAGVVWVSAFERSFSSIPFVPAECGFQHHINHAFMAADAFLDETEVSGTCYDACVKAGVCSPSSSSLGSLPATLTRSELETLCTYRGGRLPSLAELARASHDDAALPGNVKLTKAWVDCEESGFLGPDCVELAGLVPASGDPENPPRSFPQDVGPFGHYDLFGSQWEFTRTQLADENEEAFVEDWCKEDGIPPFPEELGHNGPFVLFGPARTLQRYFDFHFVPIANPINEASESNENLLGGRCAFEVVDEG